mgnify:FL=1
MENKHHYRNVFKSDHLSSADLEDLLEQGTKLIFTIREVKQEKGAKVAGKKIDANIAYFNETIKPLVLNATNSKTVKSFAKTKDHPNGSPFVEDWKNLTIELYVDDNVQMKGEKTQGVRVRPIQPRTEKPKPVFTESNFEKAKTANVTREKIEQIYILTDEVYDKYIDYVGAKE